MFAYSMVGFFTFYFFYFYFFYFFFYLFCFFFFNYLLFHYCFRFIVFFSRFFNGVFSDLLLRVRDRG